MFQVLVSRSTSPRGAERVWKSVPLTYLPTPESRLEDSFPLVLLTCKNRPLATIRLAQSTSNLYILSPEPSQRIRWVRYWNMGGRTP